MAGQYRPHGVRELHFCTQAERRLKHDLGQGALVLRDTAAIKNPFYLLAPAELLFALVALATAATVIASQATISGAFSMTQQATRLGYLPRIPVTHTSESERGQIYIGHVNWTEEGMRLLIVWSKTGKAPARESGVRMAKAAGGA